MTWKDTVNTGLVRLTGYELARLVLGGRSYPQHSAWLSWPPALVRPAPVSPPRPPCPRTMTPRRCAPSWLRCLGR